MTFPRAPRTGFEYANLGYALLGRVIAVASGEPYVDFVERELLAPLGMTATRFASAAVDDANRAHGYALVDGTLVAEPTVGTGAFSAMGGLHSSVRDLARWVDGFARPDAAANHPLSAASRREMQAGRTFIACGVESRDATPVAVTALYGYGLFDTRESTGTRFVHHSGGYPGFGSHMRWHPQSGLGIVALATDGGQDYTPYGWQAGSALNNRLAYLAYQQIFSPTNCILINQEYRYSSVENNFENHFSAYQRRASANAVPAYNVLNFNCNTWAFGLLYAVGYTASEINSMATELTNMTGRFPYGAGNGPLLCTLI